MGKLSDIAIRNWIKAGTPIAKADGDGLTFTMSAKQAAEWAGTWVLRYRLGGRQRELTLGNYPAITLKIARELTTEARVKIQQGIDVAREKQTKLREAISAWTVRQLADDYMKKAAPGLSAATVTSRKQKIRDYVLPSIGHLPAKDVTGSDIVQMLERTEGRSPKLVKPVLSSARLVFAHGIAKKIVAGDPCAGITVKSIAGSTAKGKTVRVMLTRAELHEMLTSLPTVGRINELVVRILLGTAARIQALMLAEWVHIDFNRKEWTIPPGDGRKIAKDGKAFVVTLTEDVVGYFAELQAMNSHSRFVLPVQRRQKGREDDASMQQHTINQALNRLAETLGDKCRRFTPHDLRSTARSHLAGLGVNVIVAERCLNHAIGGLVEVYDQHDYLSERRAALEKWEAFLRTCESGADWNVVPIKGKTAA